VKIFEFLALHNYCEGIMIFTALITFIFSLRHYRTHRAFRIIPYYIAFCLAQAMVDCYVYSSPRGDRFAFSLEDISTAAFTIFEFCVFSLLILPYITGAGRRLAIKLNVVLFFLAEALLYLRTFPRVSIYSMCLVELIALVPPCLIYFYELFTSMNTKALKDRASFWIVTGILYLGICSFTLLLSFEYMGRFGDGAYALGNLFYSILFVLFIRAYKCSPEKRVVVW
jgi:hypothetical protein